jgi:hypothetical protein
MIWIIVALAYIAGRCCVLPYIRSDGWSSELWNGDRITIELVYVMAGLWAVLTFLGEIGQ